MIVRSPRPTADYTIIANAIVRDASLSYRARGLLILLLSMPDNWETSSMWLAARAPEGRDAVRKALKELEGRGYLRRTKQRGPDGRIRIVTTVFDRPQEHQKPKPEKPAPVNQSVTKN